MNVSLGGFLKKMMEGRVETRGSSQRCLTCLDHLTWTWNAPDLSNWAPVLPSLLATWLSGKYGQPHPPPPPFSLHKPVPEKSTSSVKGIITSMNDIPVIRIFLWVCWILCTQKTTSRKMMSEKCQWSRSIQKQTNGTIIFPKWKVTGSNGRLTSPDWACFLHHVNWNLEFMWILVIYLANVCLLSLTISSLKPQINSVFVDACIPRRAGSLTLSRASNIWWRQERRRNRRRNGAGGTAAARKESWDWKRANAVSWLAFF